MVTAWLRAALAAGQVKYFESDKDFPARIWYRDTDTGRIWIGYCVNSIAGEYKGWPISEEGRIAVFGRLA